MLMTTGALVVVVDELVWPGPPIERRGPARPVARKPEG